MGFEVSGRLSVSLSFCLLLVDQLSAASAAPACCHTPCLVSPGPVAAVSKHPINEQKTLFISEPVE